MSVTHFQISYEVLTNKEIDTYNQFLILKDDYRSCFVPNKSGRDKGIMIEGKRLSLFGRRMISK